MQNGDNSLQYLHPTPPSLREVLHKLGPLPSDALFMGVVIEDGLPFLFDMSIMHTKDRVLIRSGNSTMLHTVVDSIKIRNSELDYIIISSKSGWGDSPRLALLSDIEDVEKFLIGAKYWIKKQKAPNVPFIVFIDGLEGMRNASRQAQESLSWILQNGTEYRSFVFATAFPSSQNVGNGFTITIEYDENRQLYRFGHHHVWCPEDK